MSSPVIQVENLSKYYRLGLIGGGTLNEDLQRWFAKIRGKPDPFLMPGEMESDERKDGHIWALKDVNLEVNEGEILGVIGRNGAGKSTLLKMLSKITTPTEGRIKVKGRVGSLLEVGTGFHPELTGRENIYLNGAILGMRHSEITSKLEEIIEFAEMAKFIDTPVKRYSSGMRVRLAFAVAAHLEPEILVIDEVLAVGDISFQNKCLGKMEEVANVGRTVIFVSHNMGSVRKLCNRGMLLDGGKSIKTGGISDVIDEYLDDKYYSNTKQDRCSGQYLKSLEFVTKEGCVRDTMLAGDSGSFRITYDMQEDVLTDVCVTIAIYDRLGSKLITLSTQYSSQLPAISSLSSKGTVECQMGAIHLAPGLYRVNIAIDGKQYGSRKHDGIINAIDLKIIPSDFYGTNRINSSEDGIVLVQQNWTHLQADRLA